MPYHMSCLRSTRLVSRETVDGLFAKHVYATRV